MTEISNNDLLSAVQDSLDQREDRIVQRIDDLDKRMNGRIAHLEKTTEKFAEWMNWSKGHSAGVKQIRDGKAWVPPAVAGLAGSIGGAVIGSLIYLLK